MGFGQTRPLSILALSLMATIASFQHASSAYQSSSSISSSSTLTTTSLVQRPRSYKVPRRPESCREQLPRKSEDLPVLVITGRVKEVYLAGESSNATLREPSTFNGPTGEPNRALVSVGRVIKGSQQLLGSDILVSGFNSSTSSPCPNYVKLNDTLILLLEPESPGTDARRYAIQASNLLAMSLNNLDRVNALAADEPYKRRGPIEDILCEAQYCPYGRCFVLSEQPPQVTCKCPDSCPPLPTPVCGSDNVTYTNECHLIKEGCRLKRPLFVTKPSSC